jgi:hypothetical protein
MSPDLCDKVADLCGAIVRLESVLAGIRGLIVDGEFEQAWQSLAQVQPAVTAVAVQAGTLSAMCEGGGPHR